MHPNILYASISSTMSLCFILWAQSSAVHSLQAQTFRSTPRLGNCSAVLTQPPPAATSRGETDVCECLHQAHTQDIIIESWTLVRNDRHPYTQHLAFTQYGRKYDFFLIAINYWHPSTENIIIHLLTVLWFSLYMNLCPCNTTLLCSPDSLKMHLEMPISYTRHPL